MRVFVAGASGVVGRRLVPQLVDRGHDVVATARTPEKLDSLRALGAEAVVMDGLDAASVGEAVARAEPEVVIHQMSALAGMSDLRRFDEEFALTNELRTRGLDHLLTASEAVGVRRFVAQSYTGWPNERVGGPVKTESDPLDPDPPAQQRRSIEAIGYLERAVTSAAPIEGVALRYGSLYGPGTSMANEYADLDPRRGSSRSSATAPASGRSSTPTTPPRRRSSRPRAEPRASTTSSTTSRRPSRSGCRTWPSAWAPGRRGTCRPGSHVSRSARSASR